jgi:hypothetical protein
MTMLSFRTITRTIEIVFIVAFSGCGVNDSNWYPVPAPSRELSPAEIFSLERITSIHFVELYHSTVNGIADTGFSADGETHIDSIHWRYNQYYLGTPGWNVTVYDLADSVVWNYYSGQVTYPELPDIGRAYTTNVQAGLGSFIIGEPIYLRSELIGDKFCDVFTDTTGYVEWVWREHRLPIQRRGEWWYNGIHQITYRRLKIEELNVPFQDGIFEPPGKY